MVWGCAGYFSLAFAGRFLIDDATSRSVVPPGQFTAIVVLTAVLLASKRELRVREPKCCLLWVVRHPWLSNALVVVAAIAIALFLK